MSDFKRKYFSRNNFFFNWAANAVELAVESAVLLIVTVGLNTLLLNLIKMCWYTYKGTHVGQVFLKKFGNNYSFFVEILDEDIISVSCELTLSAFILCLVIGSICQFVYLVRFYQGSPGLLHRFIYWGFPLTIIVSAYFFRRPIYIVEHWSAAYILYFVPTLCVYALCFKISGMLFPELAAVVKVFYSSFCFIIDHTVPAEEDKPVDIGEIEEPLTPPAAKQRVPVKANITN
jgi:hypothetical protein